VSLAIGVVAAAVGVFDPESRCQPYFESHHPQIVRRTTIRSRSPMWTMGPKSLARSIDLRHHSLHSTRRRFPCDFVLAG